MNKYKQLYETMLKDAEKDINTHSTAAAGSGSSGGSGGRVGLGEIREEVEHNTRVVKKSSYYHSSSSDGSHSTAAPNHRGKQNGNNKGNSSSFHSTSTSGKGSSTNKQNGIKGSSSFHSTSTSKRSHTPNPIRIVDDESMIDGLHVEEVLLPDSSHFNLFPESPDPSVACANSTSYDTTTTGTTPLILTSPNPSNAKSFRRKKERIGGDKQSHNRISHHRTNKANDPPSTQLTEDVQKLKKKSSFHSVTSSNTKPRPKHAPSSSSSQHQHASSRNRTVHSPPMDKHESRRGRDTNTNNNNRSRDQSRERPRERSRSRGPSSSEFSVGSEQRSIKSNKSDLSTRSKRSIVSNRSNFSFRIRSRSSGRSVHSTRDNINDDESTGYPTKITVTSDITSNRQNKKGFFRKMKKLAGKVRTTLGVSGVHKYRVGDLARYRVGKVPRCLDTYDPETRTVEVEIRAVHIDAVLDMPYYTIQLPVGSSKQTNWDNLVPLAEYNKTMVSNNDPYNNSNNGIPQDEDNPSFSRGRNSLRHGSGSRQRSHSRGDDDDRSTRSGASHRSSRSNVSHRSSRSDAFRRSSTSRGSRSSSSEHHRPSSPSPFSREDGRQQQQRRDRNYRPRSSSVKKQHHRERSSSPRARGSSGRRSSSRSSRRH